MTTTLRKLISEINFDDKRIQDEVNWEELTNYFGIYDFYWSEDTRLKCYFIRTWYCTDSYVGLRAYFLDGEFVATSFQGGRKAHQDFEFVSLELAKKVRDYILSLRDGEDDLKINVLEDLDEEMPNTYKIEYNSQILHKTALLNGERVEIIKKRYPWDDKENYFHTVEVKNKEGKTFEIDCRELDFEYNTLD